MIQENLQRLYDDIAKTAGQCGRTAESIRLVAVSKKFPAQAILEARQAGQFLFGENYVQEAVAKKAELQDKVRFHFIGHLQSNKIKAAADTFDMIETIDRFKIASALNDYLEKQGRRMDVLVQVNIGRDQNKAGVSPEAAEQLLIQLRPLAAIDVKGLMTIAPLTETAEEARPYYRDLRLLSEKLIDRGILEPDGQFELSMGMSGDYRVAIEEGATLIRVGTAIFGSRPARDTI